MPMLRYAEFFLLHNRLKVYEGLYCMATRNFILDSISTFTTYDLLPYDTFIFYTVLTSVISLDRVSLKQKVVDAPEILAVIGKAPHLSEFSQLPLDLSYLVHVCSPGCELV